MSECPTCNDDFDTEHGMKVHHVQAHDESLAQVECECKNRGKISTEHALRIEAGTGRSSSKGCRYPAPRADVTCENCGSVVERPKHLAKRYHEDYCSQECYLEVRRKGGENAPGWIDGRFSDPEYDRDYNKKWREVRPKAIERDRYECQVCGMTEAEHKQKYDASLHVHHIRPVSEFEDVDDAHELSNLITLCLPCHHRWEGIPLKPVIA
jgi:hypothetical protein